MKYNKTLKICFLALVASIMLLPGSLQFFDTSNSVLIAAPKADLWDKWTAHNPDSDESLDHQIWENFLAENLISDHPSGVNRVRYSEVTTVGKKSLDNYLSYLQGIKISSHNRKVQKAYWINFYNALTVKVILDHYPVKSIRDIDISSGWFDDGPWDAKLVTVEENLLSLNDMEHRILRPIWKDNRIHYVVNCASIGCPNIRPEAFTVENSETLLEQAAIDYINHKRGVFLIDQDELLASSIYDWYGVDFGDSEKALIDHFLLYAKQDLKAQLETFKGDIDYDYDWNLNKP